MVTTPSFSAEIVMVYEPAFLPSTVTLKTRDSASPACAPATPAKSTTSVVAHRRPPENQAIFASSFAQKYSATTQRCREPFWERDHSRRLAFRQERNRAGCVMVR